MTTKHDERYTDSQNTAAITITVVSAGQRSCAAQGRPASAFTTTTCDRRTLHAWLTSDYYVFLSSLLLLHVYFYNSADLNGPATVHLHFTVELAYSSPGLAHIAASPDFRFEANSRWPDSRRRCALLMRCVHMPSREKSSNASIHFFFSSSPEPSSPLFAADCAAPIAPRSLVDAEQRADDTQPSTSGSKRVLRTTKSDESIRRLQTAR